MAALERTTGKRVTQSDGRKGILFVDWEMEAIKRNISWPVYQKIMDYQDGRARKGLADLGQQMAQARNDYIFAALTDPHK